MTTRDLPDGPPRRRPIVFAVRLWQEEMDGRSEYRGNARDVVRGAFCSFRDWSELTTFMVARLEEASREREARSDDARGAERRWQ